MKVFGLVRQRQVCQGCMRCCLEDSNREPKRGNSRIEGKAFAIPGVPSGRLTMMDQPTTRAFTSIKYAKAPFGVRPSLSCSMQDHLPSGQQADVEKSARFWLLDPFDSRTLYLNVVEANMFYVQPGRCAVAVVICDLLLQASLLHKVLDSRVFGLFDVPRIKTCALAGGRLAGKRLCIDCFFNRSITTCRLLLRQ